LNTARHSGEPFFYVMGLVMLAFVVGGFSANAMVNPQALPPVSATIVVHAASMVLWYSIFVLQAGLVRHGKTLTHTRLGMISIVLAASVVVSGFAIAALGFERTGDSVIALAGFVNITNFAVLYFLALNHRRTPAIHKRLLVFGGIMMMPPALTRVARAAGLDDFAGLPLWIGLVVAVLVYDRVTNRSITWATCLGGAMFVCTLVIVLSFGDSSAWVNFLTALLRDS